MRIEVRYSVSEGPHPIEISQEELDQMLESGQLTAKQKTRGGTKTITITGTQHELSTLTEALKKYAETLG